MNRQRPSLLALPAGVKMQDFLFEPDEAEKQAYRATLAEKHRQNSLRRLAKLKQRWDEEDNAQRKRLRARRVKELESVVAADREFVAKENEKERRRMAAEAETKKIADYYINEQHKELLARLHKATGEINRDIIRTERKELERRGVIRGRSRQS
jgi:predicted polyphosphate/ATP-dependent NAD kinase